MGGETHTHFTFERPEVDVEMQKCASRCVCTVMNFQDESPFEEPLGYVQSESVGASEGGAAPTTVGHATTSFVDEMPGVSIGAPAHESGIELDDAVTSAGLTDFLSRPVRIASFTWNESDTASILQTYSPWQLYFNNANVKYKLNNFAFLRCNLKLKIVVNASPFYYGALRMCYQPLPNFTPSTIINDAGTRYFMPYSQQPGLWVSPQHSEGGEMMLPFFWPRNFLRAQKAQDFTDMGTIRFINYCPLQSANGVTGQGVSVQVYAWAEDVVLAGPSGGLAMQSDEYGTGPVSRVASTVGSIAGVLKGVPIIGKFATATEMGAKAIGGIAKLFGFTNVPVIEPTQPYRPQPFPMLASTEIGYPTEKLTLDSKNELSIDPSIIGLEPKDELSVENIVTKSSWLVTSTWSTTTAVDTPLFTSRVNPAMYWSDGGTNAKIYRTPMALVASLFSAWRGDIIFTFKFVASPYHKGRVRISYDPYDATIQTTGDTGAIVFNTVVDIGGETEVDFRVPYQQALPWLVSGNALTTANMPFSISTTPSLTVNDTFDNGIISVKVLTLLTAPVATSNIQMMVFVRAADNFEVSNPVAPNINLSNYAVQSEALIEQAPVEEVSGEEHNPGDKPTEILMERSRLNFGEVVRSLRVLLRRSNFVQTYTNTTATTNALVLMYSRFVRFPRFYGYDPTGLESAKGLVLTGSNFSFNFTAVTPWHIIAPCFVAQRGSAIWHFNVDNPQFVNNLSVTRNNYAAYTPVNNVSSQALGTTSANAAWYRNIVNGTGGGTALTNQRTNAGISVLLPNYTPFKFQSTSPSNFSNPPTVGTSGDDGSGAETYVLAAYHDNTASLSGAASSINTRIHSYFGIGTDYNLHYFLNVPTLVLYSGPPVPN